MRESGPAGARSPNLRLAGAALSQLSYRPMEVCKLAHNRTRTPDDSGEKGLELPARSAKAVAAGHTNIAPQYIVARQAGQSASDTQMASACPTATGQLPGEAQAIIARGKPSVSRAATGSLTPTDEVPRGHTTPGSICANPYSHCRAANPALKPTTAMPRGLQERSRQWQ